MSAGKVVNLSSAFAELNRYGQNGDHERALKTANKSKFFNEFLKKFTTFKLYWVNMVRCKFSITE